ARVGLEERFSIIDEREAAFIRRESVNAWLASHSLDDYIAPALDDSKRDWIRRQQLPNLVDSLALAFIRSSKDRLLTPEGLRAKLDSSPAPLPLAELSYSIYADYQRALAYRGAVDFDDLIRLALTLLESDEEYLERLRFRYPFILEDEAQDSSQTQERILGKMAGPDGNWVRVGDPNQAIFETFTTASPELLRAFIRENPHADMPESGRSQLSIIALANRLIDWTMNEHPVPSVRGALDVPHIEPVPEGYEPVNPPDNPEAIRFISKKYTPEEELEAAVESVKSHLDSVADLPHEEQPTIAILVPRNARGIEVINALKKRGVETIELISSTSTTRAAAGSLNYLLSYLADPQSASKLSKAYQVWRRDIFGTNRTVGIGLAPVQSEEESAGEEQGDRKGRPYAERAAGLLRKIGRVEDYVSPALTALTPSPLSQKRERGANARGEINASDWLATLGESEAEHVIQELKDFRVYVQRWLNAVTLPIDQLTLTLAQDVFSEASDLALAHKLALVLKQAANDHADWRLPELSSELAVIAKSERRFIGFSSDDSGFDPERHRGKVVVTTMHKAKGLEWDRVYLMSVNNYDFPSLQPYDRYISEKRFVRGGLNLEAEALAQLSALESNSEYEWYEEGAATLQSRADYTRERLRLFYVGITRAKRELVLTWNSGRFTDERQAQQSLPFAALIGYMEKVNSNQ
ncbi:MAG: ATP-dependent helicase, partial [Anaerolineales bacterium]|nr:ATP-dependent helicase [Anaerolineales bacterium]